MFEKIIRGTSVKRQIAIERKKLLEGIHLAMIQWQYGHENENRGYAMMDILERRYMFLYETAKKRKLHVLE